MQIDLRTPYTFFRAGDEREEEEKGGENACSTSSSSSPSTCRWGGGGKRKKKNRSQGGLWEFLPSLVPFFRLAWREGGRGKEKKGKKRK